MNEMEHPKIRIFSIKVRPDPDVGEVEIFRVEVKSKNGIWLEIFVTEAEVRAFERGLQCGSSMTDGPHISLAFEIERRE